MKHLFVPHELAMLAKEKGFNDQCIGKFKDNNLTLLSYSWNNSELSIHNDGISAPMYQQLIDWFRDVQNLHIGLSVNQFGYGYMFSIIDIKKGECVVLSTGGPKHNFTYYEALNKALEEAFKLI